jgi:hypothetical protein
MVEMKKMKILADENQKICFSQNCNQKILSAEQTRIILLNQGRKEIFFIDFFCFDKSGMRGYRKAKGLAFLLTLYTY